MEWDKKYPLGFDVEPETNDYNDDFYDMLLEEERAAEEIIRRKNENGHPAVIHQEGNVVFVDFVTKGKL